ncbi:MAG: dTDP-4-dehydrorhamnose 3,5-epimerase [Bacteroidota bacterium]
MQVTSTPLLGLQVIIPQIIQDHRSYFCENYHEKKLAKLGIHTRFVQENQSFSRQGTIRGLHYQLVPHAQAKLIRVLAGKIWDVAVDLRQGTDTFGQWEGIILSAANKKQLLIPRGYAHGFAVLSQQATVLYKCDAFYCPAAEAGIHFLDPTLAIDWKLGTQQPIVLEKDKQLPSFQAATMNFTAV